MTLSKEQIQVEFGDNIDVLDCFHTGSNYICDPPVTDTDIDYMILHPENQAWNIQSRLSTQGWEICGTYDDTNLRDVGYAFRAFRKGNVNFIVTYEKTFFNLFKEATEIAKYLNLREKEQRVKLFKYIMEESVV